MQCNIMLHCGGRGEVWGRCHNFRKMSSSVVAEVAAVVRMLGGIPREEVEEVSKNAQTVARAALAETISKLTCAKAEAERDTAVLRLRFEQLSAEAERLRAENQRLEAACASCAPRRRPAAPRKRSTPAAEPRALVRSDAIVEDKKRRVTFDLLPPANDMEETDETEDDNGLTSAAPPQ